VRRTAVMVASGPPRLMCPRAVAVFRPYGASSILNDEFERLAAEHPDITRLVTIGRTVQGDDIAVLKVSPHAARTGDGRRPAATPRARRGRCLRRAVSPPAPSYASDRLDCSWPARSATPPWPCMGRGLIAADADGHRTASVWRACSVRKSEHNRTDTRLRKHR
jgi:hypothetical protein